MLKESNLIKMPEYSIALVNHLRQVIEREFWNKYQDTINLEYKGIESPNFVITPSKGQKGSIKYNDICIEYEYYLTNEMYSNTELNQEEWINWFNKFLGDIRNPRYSFKAF